MLLHTEESKKMANSIDPVEVAHYEPPLWIYLFEFQLFIFIALEDLIKSKLPKITK